MGGAEVGVGTVEVGAAEVGTGEVVGGEATAEVGVEAFVGTVLIKKCVLMYLTNYPILV